MRLSQKLFDFQQQTISRNKLWQKSQKFVTVQIVASVWIVDQTIRIKVLGNKIVAENILRKLKIEFFKEWEALCDGVVTDTAFDFSRVNGW